MLSFKEQNCNITLREGIEEYNSYLVANGKEILTELSHSSIVMDHDATHVIFGLDTTLEEESLLDSWVLWCSSFEFKYLMSYSKQPEIKGLYKKLLAMVEGASIYLEEYTRDLIGQEEQHQLELRKMLKDFS